jgi:hypothetical protein
MAQLPTEIVPSVAPSEQSPASVAREFQRLVDSGVPIRAVGRAKSRPKLLLSRYGYVPKYKIELFDTRFYLAGPRQNPDLRFFIVYVVQKRGGREAIHPRLFYKDLSLIWRSSSHVIRTSDELWIGKGDVIDVSRGGFEYVESMEQTTDLPLEIQDALEVCNRKIRRVPEDEEAMVLILRNAPAGRVEPYSDFTGPRRAAAADPRNLINGGRRVARFKRKNDPTSLVFAKGFEPDFKRGLIERGLSKSSMYGGQLHRVRVLSKNKQVQYLMIAGPHQAWVIPPQALTTELSSYGVRTVDVLADEDLFVPGFEYHYMDDTVDPPELFTQIPKGYAGAPNEYDDSRADASAWLEKLSVIRALRRNL